MGNDKAIVNAARVSFHKDASLYSEEQNQKLLSYLAKHKHWTPFAHTALSFRIKAPIFVARQLGKHQVGLVWNEVSRRYVDEEPEYFIPETWRCRPDNGMKQGSSKEAFQHFNTLYDIQDALEDIHNIYMNAIQKGMAPEQARMILPQNTMSEWIWTGSLMAFARVCKQRLDSHAQQETQEIAQQITKLIPKDFEQSWKVLMS